MTDMPDFQLERFLPFLLNRAAEASSLKFQSLYKERYGILRTDWRVLFHLGLYGEMNAGEIGRRAGIHKTKISRAVHRLTDRRMIARKRSGEDRRVESLSLTPCGRAAFEDLSRAAAQYEAELISVLSSDEVAVLRRALEKLMRV